MGDRTKAKSCPRCHAAELWAQLSQDGSAWVADLCPSCGATWRHEPPRMATRVPAGVVSVRVASAEAQP